MTDPPGPSYGPFYAPADSPAGGVSDAVIGSEPAVPWVTRPELRAAAGIVLALAIAGALAGVLWRAWSLPLARGIVVGPGVAIPEESEGFISSDGRFLVITASIGVLATIGVWSVRAWRGPLVAGALALGTVGGSLLTQVVGHLTGGGTTTGAPNTVIRFPLQVRAGALLLVEPLLAAVLYSLLASFASRDDLGNPLSSAPAGSVPGPEAPERFGYDAAAPSPGAPS